MNIKRIIFWLGFIIILALIVWGVVVAMNKEIVPPVQSDGSPAPISATDSVRGPEGAPVTLIEYSDFQCPACAAYYPIVERLLAEASSTVRFVYRHYPLPQHRIAEPAAQAAEAAGRQGKFWDMSGLIFVNQLSWQDLSPIQAKSVFKGSAERLGLNVANFEKDYEDSAIKAKISADYRDGQTIGVNATPTFFVNGKAITNPPNYESFKVIIDAAAAESLD